MKLIDLAHTFSEDMPTYPGDPQPNLRQTASIRTDGYTDHTLVTTMHIGTHIDAPAHMIEGGKQMHELPVELFCGKGVSIDVRGRKELDIGILAQVNTAALANSVVLFCTGFSEKYRTAEYFAEFPVMTDALARELVRRKIKMVGLDTPSPDKAPYAAHKLLLGAGILIIENLTALEALLPYRQFEVSAFPIKLAADAAPARVVAFVRV